MRQLLYTLLAEALKANLQATEQPAMTAVMTQWERPVQAMLQWAVAAVSTSSRRPPALEQQLPSGKSTRWGKSGLLEQLSFRMCSQKRPVGAWMRGATLPVHALSQICGCRALHCTCPHCAPPQAPPADAVQLSAQLAALRYGMAVYKSDPCRAARLVGTRTCAEVAARMLAGLPPGQTPLAIPASPPPPPPKKRGGTKRKGGAPKRKNNLNVRGRPCSQLHPGCSGLPALSWDKQPIVDLQCWQHWPVTVTRPARPACLAGRPINILSPWPRRLGCTGSAPTSLVYEKGRSVACAVQVVSKRIKHDKTQPWPGYTPCNCVGPCRDDCPCVLGKNFCHKFCACGNTCENLVRGCTCKFGCFNRTCPCFAAGACHPPPTTPSSGDLFSALLMGLRRCGPASAMLLLRVVHRPVG